MEGTSEYADGTFANPDVKDGVIECIVDYLDDRCKSHPYEVIVHVKNEKNTSRKMVVSGMRKLRMANKVVPAEPFTGEIELANN